MSRQTITAFGCRSPDSKGEGLWDGAFVYLDTSIGSKAGKFIDGYDYLADLSFKQAQEIYQQLITNGWTKMTPQDITKTSGVAISESTTIPF